MKCSLNIILVILGLFIIDQASGQFERSERSKFAIYKITINFTSLMYIIIHLLFGLFSIETKLLFKCIHCILKVKVQLMSCLFVVKVSDSSYCASFNIIFIEKERLDNFVVNLARKMTWSW